ncbi:hypothetical protein B0H15DRAFT_814358 [Mycena belliarum]|uniref:Uncharacterized protein n=1 Tax=Mycena belliarum TaxID=1033014 RepID=A0AAD6UN60_9AGAR|nr:hypothetical protein B0H15DRAFT_814358 [Mycena belliae]
MSPVRPFKRMVPNASCTYPFTMFRSALARSSVAHARPFHTSRPALKTVTEKVSDVADTVNKKLGKGLADAIGAGQDAAGATKESLKATSEQAKKKAGEAASVAGQKKNEATATAREVKDDVKHDVHKKSSK